MADAPILTNPLKQMMKAGKVALGMNVRLARSGDIARIAKSSGHDFIFIDGQHAIFSLETIAHIAHTALGCGITPLARVKSVDDQDVQVLLDNGVMGIVYPDVNTAAEARRAVARAKFPPIGKRSAAGAYPMFDYRPVPASQTVSALNDATLVVCMIETPERVNNVEEIAKVDGVDVIHIGANDLLTAMGKPGAFGDPEVLEEDRGLDAVDARERLEQALVRAGLHSLFQRLKRGGEDLGPLPTAERLLLEQPRGFQSLVLERQLERGAHVRLVLGEARIGAVEQLVESLLGVTVLRHRAPDRPQRFGDHRAHHLRARAKIAVRRRPGNPCTLRHFRHRRDVPALHQPDRFIEQAAKHPAAVARAEIGEDVEGSGALRHLAVV